MSWHDRHIRLRRLEAEAIFIMREVVAEFNNPVMLYSWQKDIEPDSSGRKFGWHSLAQSPSVIVGQINAATEARSNCLCF